jgi:hypothetical protein
MPQSKFGMLYGRLINGSPIKNIKEKRAGGLDIETDKGLYYHFDSLAQAVNASESP